MGTGGWRAAAALRPGRCPHPSRACAPSPGHEAAGPLSLALCLAICSPSGGNARPAPAVPQSQGLEPLRGSGCGPAASGKEDVAGIANGQQPPLSWWPRQQRGREPGQGSDPSTTRHPPCSSWLTPWQDLAPWGMRGRSGGLRSRGRCGGTKGQLVSSWEWGASSSPCDETRS